MLHIFDQLIFHYISWLLFFSQTWINSENISKRRNFLMDFDNFFRFFQCYSILDEKQRTKQRNHNSLSLFASLDTQDTLQGGITVEWKKFGQEIPVWIWRDKIFVHKSIISIKLTQLSLIWTTIREGFKIEFKEFLSSLNVRQMQA